MACDRFLELLALRLDDALSPEEARRLEEHLAGCPECRAAGAQLTALQTAFGELEEASAPGGFARAVMERVRTAERERKVVPLFRRPGFRTAAGLAACLVLVMGLYTAGRKESAGPDLMMRRAVPDVTQGEAGSVSGTGDAPQIAAYAAPPVSGSGSVEGVTQDKALIPGAAPEAYGPDVMEVILERLPEGAGDLIPPGTSTGPAPQSDAEGGTAYWDLSRETVSRISDLAVRQGIPVDIRQGDGACVLIVLEK